jgi:hypothetical protein
MREQTDSIFASHPQAQNPHARPGDKAVSTWG